MCYEALVTGEAAEKPVARLLRTELGSAVTDGTVAALVVLAVLAVRGIAPALVAGAAVGALVLGVVVHQAVLLAGTALVRWRTPDASVLAGREQTS